jgi:uncharacterized membrane protein
MAHGFALLATAAIAWVALHIGVSGSRLRGAIVARIGEGAFRGLFVVASFVVLGWLVYAYNHAGPIAQLWVAPRWLVVALMLLMLPAMLLLVCAVTMPNPTSVRGERALHGPEPARGILRITRHPMMWSFAIWGVLHIVAIGTVSMMMLAGAIVVTAFAGMPSLDAKYARREPERWPPFAAATSILPFGAILAGRNRLALGEIGWWRPLLALALWVALIAAHPLLSTAQPARYFH